MKKDGRKERGNEEENNQGSRRGKEWTKRGMNNNKEQSYLVL